MEKHRRRGEQYVFTASDSAFFLSNLGTMHLQAEFRNNSSAEVEILVLLTRHIEDTKRMSDFVSLQVEIEDCLLFGSDLRANQQYLSSRVSSKLAAWTGITLIKEQGAYTNSSQVLVIIRAIFTCQ